MSDDAVVAVLMEHLGIEEPGAAYLADKMFLHAFGSPPDVLDGPKDTAALDRLDRAFAEIAAAIDDLTWLASDTLQRSIMFGPHLEELGDGLPAEDPRAQEALKYAKEKGQPMVQALHQLEHNTHQIRAAIRASRREIETSPMARKSLSRMKLEGLQMVDGARWVWGMVKQRDAPSKDVNMASPFGKFLADLFEVCEIPGDPRSAFRNWARLNRSPHFTENETAN